MTAILAIDPGSARSAWLAYGTEAPHVNSDWGIVPNDDFLPWLRTAAAVFDVVVIETLEPRYGLSPGWETLDTARLVGRFEEAAHPTQVVRVKRSDILRDLGVVTRGPNKTTADSGVRSALIDRFGGTPAIRKGGVLYGISTDVWSALAVAVTYADGIR
jgi:hypothetical protein